MLHDKSHHENPVAEAIADSGLIVLIARFHHVPVNLEGCATSSLRPLANSVNWPGQEAAFN